MKKQNQKKSKLKFVVGLSDQGTVKLDLDGFTEQTAQQIAERTNNWFQLEGYALYTSSLYNYHVIFNRPVSWQENVHVMAWVALQNFSNSHVVKWCIMQCIKESSTLRISPKGDKPAPQRVSGNSPYVPFKGAVDKWEKTKKEAEKLWKTQ